MKSIEVGVKISKSPNIPTSFNKSKKKLCGWLSHTLLGRWIFSLQEFLNDLMPPPNNGFSKNKSIDVI